jgi:hypothetical protein
MTSNLPNLSGAEPTLQTLNHYAKAIGAVPRALSAPHPKWWHISLKVQESGAATDPIPHPSADNVSFKLLMNLQSHAVEISTSHGQFASVSMAEAQSASGFGGSLLAALQEIGIQTEVERELFEDEGDRSYDMAHAEAYRQALNEVDQLLKVHRADLQGETSPVQLWPHHFDLAFEWFGTRAVIHEEDGETTEHPSQINFGFSPGDGSHPAPYFYSNPWPFQDQLVGDSLPSGARWFTESWQGTLLPYSAVSGGSSEALTAYFRRVFELASPHLLK